MKNFFTLVFFEFKLVVKSKTTLVILFLLSLLVIFGGLLLSKPSSQDIKKIYMNNKASLNIKDLETEINNYDKDFLYKVVETSEKDNYPSIVLENKENVIFLEVNYENKSQEDPYMEQLLISTISNKQNNKIFSNEKYTNVSVEKKYKESTNPMMISLIIVMIIYLFTILCGSTITNSVALDKLNNIFDVLIFKTRAVILVYSKIFSVMLIVILAIIILILELNIMNIFGLIQLKSVIDYFKELSISQIDLIYIILFSFLGCLLYTLLYSISGIFVTSISQIQFAQLPVSIILMLSTFLGIYGVYDQSSIAYRISIYIPMISPFTIPIGILNNQISINNLIISSVIFISTIITISIVINKKILPNRVG